MTIGFEISSVFDKTPEYNLPAESQQFVCFVVTADVELETHVAQNCDVFVTVVLQFLFPYVVPWTLWVYISDWFLVQ